MFAPSNEQEKFVFADGETLNELFSHQFVLSFVAEFVRLSATLFQ